MGADWARARVQERAGANSGDLWDSSVAWGCLVHALAACVSQTLLLSPPWGDTGVPAFTLLSHTRAWHSPARRWQAQPPGAWADPHPGTPLWPGAPYPVGPSTPVGTAEALGQPWPPFPLEAVAVSDCHRRPAWCSSGLLGVSETTELWLFPSSLQNGTWRRGYSLGGGGGRLSLA